MSNRKAMLYAAALFALTACSKQDVTKPENSVTQTIRSDVQQQSLYFQTIHGLIEQNSSSDQTKQHLNEAGLNLVRIPVFLSQTSFNRSIDDFLNDGYNVQINANWFAGINGYRTFPKDTNRIKSQAEAFFQHYAPYKSRIPFVAVENEWDYEVLHGSNLQDYLKELSIITAIGHKYGFVMTDGAITSGTLQRWTYSQLTGQQQEQWKLNYYVGLNNNYETLTNIVNTFIAGVKNINLDYINVHWYNSSKCGNGFATATQVYKTACNKIGLVCNEFGIRTNSQTLFQATVDEIKGYAKYGIAYNGSSLYGKAIRLTDPMLDYL